MSYHSAELATIVEDHSIYFWLTRIVGVSIPTILLEWKLEEVSLTTVHIYVFKISKFVRERIARTAIRPHLRFHTPPRSRTNISIFGYICGDSLAHLEEDLLTLERPRHL